MYIDVENEFSDAQALTATAASTNYIDLGSAVQIGVGKPLWVVIQLDVAADAGSANETYVADLETDDNTSFSSATTIATKTITRGDAAGTRYVIAVPLSGVERYLRLNYTLGGTTPTVTLSAWLTGEEIETFVAYPDAVN